MQQAQRQRRTVHYEQRSKQLLEKAREVKRARTAERREAALRVRLEAALEVVDAVRRAFPAVAAAVGLPAVQVSKSCDERRADNLNVLALRPAIRGHNAALVAQKRAVSIVARAVLDVQRNFVGEAFAARCEGGEPTVPVVAVAWQWDETSQKMRNILTMCIGCTKGTLLHRQPGR